MLGRCFLTSCLVLLGGVAACEGEATVDEDVLPDAGTIPDGATAGDGSASSDDASADTSSPDVVTDAPDDAEAGCAPPTVSCGDGCFDLTSTKEHCGACGNVCLDGLGTAGCAQQTCGCTNPAHTYCANAGCFATDTDVQHCGADCKPCPPSSTCQQGVCVCDAKFAECQVGICSSLETDTNCGRCGNTCGDGASCVNGKCRFSPAGATCPPWGLAHGSTSSSIYWTEMCAGAAAIRRCALASGCQTLPAPLYTASSGSLPCGIVAATGTDGNEYYFNTDNQGPSNNRLWRSLGTGGNRTDWSGLGTGGPSAIVSNGTHLWWGSGSGVYRSSVDSPGATAVLDANPSLQSPGSAPQSVAIDATHVYAARQAHVGKPDGIVACPLAGNCSTSGEVQIFTGTGVSAIVSDGNHVFFSTRNSGVDSVYRCPIAGCAAGASPLWTANVALNPGRAVPIAIDADNVYINSRSGELLACPKNGATCAAPKVLHENVNAGSMITLGGYVYWTEGTAPRGVYRALP